MNHEQMQMEFVRKLPIPQEIKKQFPISEKIATHKAERDEAIRRVFTGAENYKIIGDFLQKEKLS